MFEYIISVYSEEYDCMTNINHVYTREEALNFIKKEGFFVIPWLIEGRNVGWELCKTDYSVNKDYLSDDLPYPY